MLTDNLLKLSAAQAVTATAVSTNVVDLKTATDLGPGDSIFAIITVDEAATAAGAATVTFEVVTSASSDLSTPTVVVASTPVGKAALTIGRNPVNLVIPVHISEELGQRYIGVRYTVTTGPLTAGKFTCYLSPSAAHKQKNYASGFTVL
jgi:hypothetical protein